MQAKARGFRSGLTGVVIALGLSTCACEEKTEAPESVPSAAAEAPATASTMAATASAAAAPSASERPELVAPDDVAKPPKDAKTTPSGLATKVLVKGEGTKKPAINDSVKVHYTGWTTDGNMFDSSHKRGEPTTFGVAQVVPGWTEGLQLMVGGEKRRMWLPAKLAYGDRPRMGAPSGPLTFDVELIEILAPPEAPKDVAKPPKDAKKTASGLRYKVVKAGTGTEHPTATSRVTVHYSGWTPDGKLFDSSITRQQPSTFGLGSVVKGWTEGVQLMVKGEKTLFWIPADLAYGDKPKRPGAPSGPLVFEIELLEIR
jgi:peptidylprolyl isomerase